METHHSPVIQKLLNGYILERDRKIEISNNDIYDTITRQFHKGGAQTYAWIVDLILAHIDRSATETEILSVVMMGVKHEMQELREEGQFFSKDDFYYGRIYSYQGITYSAQCARGWQ